MSHADVTLLDSTVLVAYERDLTRRTQTFVVNAFLDERVLLTSALSATTAAAQLGHQVRELSFLLHDPEAVVRVLELGLSGFENGSSAREPSLEAVETAVVAAEARATGATIFTFEPDRYKGWLVDVVDMRP
ncbi:hypothetical protein JK358_35885 [Nocardia sp. 2]|uniref:PIN domain-containing protein n=1 Tax=Nocardia acididurans TaxID=2802282 RepID=A0ABS1MGK3_9NOCA|nr:hypothetical protein [Nocardia acididurans]MBL1079797.1 hypothetical protein [Nocardia acididurans]